MCLKTKQNKKCKTREKSNSKLNFTLLSSIPTAAERSPISPVKPRPPGHRCPSLVVKPFPSPVVTSVTRFLPCHCCDNVLISTQISTLHQPPGLLLLTPFLQGGLSNKGILNTLAWAWRPSRSRLQPMTLGFAISPSSILRHMFHISSELWEKAQFPEHILHFLAQMPTWSWSIRL